MTFPKFKDLPPVQGMPHGCAWGVFDKVGHKDNLGTINHLTQEVVKEAKNELKEGIHVALDWPLDSLDPPSFGRKKFEMSIHDNGDTSCDDILNFNPQSSSQWDSLLHVGYQGKKLFYNGNKLEDIVNRNPEVPSGIDSWAKRGGIVGRGVLLDFVAYAERHSITYKPNERVGITIDVLESIAREENVEFKKGDIILVRTGFTEWYETAPVDQRLTINKATLVGVESGVDAAAWFWDHQFSAVAGDNPAFEAWPPKSRDYESLHFYFLPMFGMPIGELWDLKRLGQVCRNLNRYSFFFTSAPLNIKNGISSPPNALAIF